jgi:hypothetical protein
MIRTQAFGAYAGGLELVRRSVKKPFQHVLSRESQRTHRLDRGMLTSATDHLVRHDALPPTAGLPSTAEGPAGCVEDGPTHAGSITKTIGPSWAAGAPRCPDMPARLAGESLRGLSCPRWAFRLKNAPASLVRVPRGRCGRSRSTRCQTTHIQ